MANEMNVVEEGLEQVQKAALNKGEIGAIVVVGGLALFGACEVVYHIVKKVVPWAAMKIELGRRKRKHIQVDPIPNDQQSPDGDDSKE